MTKSEGADLTTIATFTSGVEAAIAQQTLAAAGIDAYIHGDSMATTMWHLGVAMGGVKLQVAARDEEVASGLIAAARSGELSDESSEGSDEGEDEDDITSATTHVDDAAHRALKSAVFALMFPPLCLYTGWLLLEIWRSNENVSGKSRRRAVVAGIIAAVVAGWFLFFMTVFVQNLIDPYQGTALPSNS